MLSKMHIKNIILLLGFWKSIYCQDCTFSYGPSNNCHLSIMCEATSDIANIADSRIFECEEWNRRATFRHISPSDYVITSSITCSSCENERVFNSFVEFEIFESTCNNIPLFENFPNVELIRIHETNLKVVSITTQYLGKLTLLDLAQNNISYINTLQLYSSSNLQVLNISHNVIDVINDKVFQYIPSLNQLDLTSNMINRITSNTFYGLVNINKLYLSHNRIAHIDNAFESLTALEELYLDHNNLNEIKENYFKGLDNLQILKLNSNSIKEFDWKAMAHIPVLRVFDVSNNVIEIVNKNAFVNNNILNYVDFSNNHITRLIPNTFLRKTLSYFALTNNCLTGGLVIGMFEGMKEVRKLDLSHQNIDAVGDHTFYGLTRLSILLLNDNKIQNISKIAFYSLMDLELLDLSNNLLQVIDFENNELNNLKGLQLRNNVIRDIGKNFFLQMNSLQLLDLSQNYLTSLNSDIYDPILPHLVQFNISRNNLQVIQDDIFDKCVNLLSIDLSHNSNLTIASNNSTKHTHINNNVDIAQASGLHTLVITNCYIDHVTFLKLNVFKYITSIDFNHNQLPKIEYGMISSNKDLIYLDLSYNKISHIQPGSFKDNNKLKELNVAHNELLEIEYGSFGGLGQLNFLDISFNKIKSLKHGRFYDTPSLSTLIVDNNYIETVEHDDFAGANLKTLSIGGNPLPCLSLVNLKIETHSLQVKAINEELHLPNFKGISCNPSNQSNEKSNIDDNMYSDRRDALLEDIRNILLEIKKANNSERSGVVLQTSNAVVEKKYQKEANEKNNAIVLSDKLKSNVGELMQPNQSKLSILSDVCLVFIAAVMLSIMVYKVYKKNVFRSLRRQRRTASTQQFNESIATASV